MHNHRLALGVRIRINRHSVVLGAHANLGWFFLNDGLYAFEAVEGVESGDGEAVPDDGEKDEPVYDGDHGAREVVFFFGHCFAGLRKEVAGMLDVEYGADACAWLLARSNAIGGLHVPMGPK